MEETRDYINNIEIEYGATGTAITITSNKYYDNLYVFPHSSLFKAIDSVSEDIQSAIEMEMER